MGKKDLKDQHKDLVINIIDVLADLDPSKTNKFLPLLIKHFKKESDNFKKYVGYEISGLVGSENLRALKDFNEHLDNNRTKIKDISLIKDFRDLHEQLVYAELKLKKKDIKKEISILYKDKEWLVLKPLSYEASKIYGAGTKWCTSSREEDKPFYNYSNDGVLLYLIKLGTNEKYGVHWYFEKEKSVEMSWWDVEDRKVDSLTLNVPSKITQIVLDHYLTTKQPNSYYFKGRDKKRALEYINIALPVEPPTVPPMPPIEVVGCNIIPIDFGVRTGVLGPEPPLEGTGNVSDPQWTLYDGNTTTTLNVDGLVNKTLEYTYMAKAMKKSLEDLDN